MFPQTGQDGSALLILNPQRQLGRPQVEGSSSWEVEGRGQQVLAQVGQVTWGRLQVTPWKQGQVGFLQQVGDFTDLK